MHLKYKNRKKLDALSKLLTGKSSGWKKSLRDGFVANMEETLEDGTVRKYRGIKYPTLRDVKREMDKQLAEKVLKDKREAEVKAKQEEAIKNVGSGTEQQASGDGPNETSGAAPKA